MTQVLDKYRALKKYVQNASGKDSTVTPREYECLALMAHGKRIKEISLLLKISARTVDTYLIRLNKNKGIWIVSCD